QFAFDPESEFLPFVRHRRREESERSVVVRLDRGRDPSRLVGVVGGGWPNQPLRAETGPDSPVVARPVIAGRELDAEVVFEDEPLVGVRRAAIRWRDDE